MDDGHLQLLRQLSVLVEGMKQQSLMFRWMALISGLRVLYRTYDP